MEVPDVEVKGIEIPNTHDVWVNTPYLAIPTVPAITQTIYVGIPVIDMPGCVQAHKDGEKNMVLKDDDPDGVMVFCDGETPSFNPIEYTPEDLIITQEAPVPPVANTEQPTLETPPIPEIPETTTSETVETTEEPSTDWVEEYLPSPAEVSTTASIAVIATGAAAATPLLLKVVKPIVKQIIKKVQKALGKEPPKLTLSEIKTNKYREKKGLSPVKRKKKKSQ